MNPENRDEKQIKALLGRLRDTETAEPSPYLKTRVLARVREEKRKASRVRQWLWGFCGATATGAVAMIAWIQVSSPTFKAVAHQPVAVRVDMKDLGGKNIARATVELPEGVQFFSKKFPEIAAKTSLDLPVAAAPHALPIVIQADEAGMKSVKVRFFNEENRFVAERVLKIQFKRSSV